MPPVFRYDEGQIIGSMPPVHIQMLLLYVSSIEWRYDLCVLVFKGGWFATTSLRTTQHNYGQILILIMCLIHISASII